MTWQTYHGAASLDGCADIALPDTLAQAWRYDAGSAVLNTPVSGGGRICLADSKGGIHALDMDGKKIWSRQFTTPAKENRPAQPVSFDAPLTLVDATLIAGTGDGTLYALDAANGEVRWQVETGWPILGTPNVADIDVNGKPEKRIFVIGQADGALQCFDFNTGKATWKGKGVARCDGSPAVSAQYAAYGSCASAVHIFSTADGAMIHEVSFDQDSQVAGGVVLLGDEIYSGSRSGKFIHANAKSGKAVWTNTDCEGEAFTTPAVDKEHIVYGANDAVLYALKRDSGKLAWKQKLNDTPLSPVIARDKVVVSAAGTLYLLQLADGKILWSFPVSDEITSAGIAGPYVVVGAGDGVVTAFGAK